jgi:hypothetical protein
VQHFGAVPTSGHSEILLRQLATVFVAAELSVWLAGILLATLNVDWRDPFRPLDRVRAVGGRDERGPTLAG